MGDPHVRWDRATRTATPTTWPAPALDRPGANALFYEGVPFLGKETRVFAYLGLPETVPDEGVSGMVLVHGGGGTAFPEWVRLWTRRGYAAIAMDTCGCTWGGKHAERPSHEWAGPQADEKFARVSGPPEDQWGYHAIAAISRAYSLLASRPAVDEKRIGLTGISWGGFLTCIAAGVDDRFRFACPVYGCGFTGEESVGRDKLAQLPPGEGEQWLDLWDPKHYLPGARMPMLWINGTNDFAFPLPSWRASHCAAPGTRTLCLRVNMAHGQEPGAAPEEIYAFAEQHLNDGPPLARITRQCRDGRHVRVEFAPSPASAVVKAELNLTADDGVWMERTWTTVPLTPADGHVAATLPERWTAYYLNLVDARGCVVSTAYEDAENP